MMKSNLHIHAHVNTFIKTHRYMNGKEGNGKFLFIFVHPEMKNMEEIMILL